MSAAEHKHASLPLLTAPGPVCVPVPWTVGHRGPASFSLHGQLRTGTPFCPPGQQPQRAGSQGHRQVRRDPAGRRHRGSSVTAPAGGTLRSRRANVHVARRCVIRTLTVDQHLGFKCGIQDLKFKILVQCGQNQRNNIKNVANCIADL